MSFDNVNHHALSRVAGADLSAAQYKAVKLNSSGAAVLAGAGEFAIGILQNNPASGVAAMIATVGAISKAKAGGSITAGATVAVNASGLLVDAAEATVNTSDAGAAAVRTYLRLGFTSSVARFSQTTRLPLIRRCLIGVYSCWLA